MTESVESTEPLSREGLTESAPSFAVPEAYADKGWAGNVSSEDDMWKQFDNLQGLAGKKSIPNAESSDEDWTSFYNQLRPESHDKYELNLPEGSEIQVNDEQQLAAKQFFHDNGFTQKQAQALFDYDLQRQAATQETQPSAEDLDADFNTKMVDKFGDDASKVLASTMKAIQGMDKELANTFSNEQLVALSEVFHNQEIVRTAESTSPQRGDVLTPRSSLDIRKSITELTSKIQKTDPFDHTREGMKDQLKILQKQHRLIAEG